MTTEGSTGASRPDPPSRGTPPPSAGRDLPRAIAVGVLLVALLLGSLVWHPAAFTGFVALLLVVATVETSRVLRGAQRPVAVPVVLAAGLVMVIGSHVAGARGQVAGVLVLFLGAALWELVDRRRAGVAVTLGTTLLLGLWLGLLASYAPLLVTRPSEGRLALLATVGGAVLSDIGGYAFGSLLGRHSLAPVVSPNKTWEGVLGGVALAGVAGAVVLPLLGDLVGPALGAVVGVASALAAVVGDLLESMVKRDLGVKDLGRVLPGHGGILDRVDGILVALPVGHYVVELLA